jgi:low temperature requirement protein LtrA
MSDAVSHKHKLFRQRHADKHHSPVTYIELFFDLVFVFAVTQLSHRLLAHLNLEGALETLILFCAVWWAWVYTSWATNWLDPERGPVRIMMMAVMFAGLALAVAIPDAFGSNGWLFALAYGAIQLGRTLYLMWAFHGVRSSGVRNFARITAWFVLSAPFWAWGAVSPPDLRAILWALAIAIEYAAPFVFFRFPGLGRSTGEDWDISGGHMAERCALFIIIALGEAILVTGATFAELPHDQPTTTAFIAGFVASAAMWWIYFDIGARRASALMEQTDQAGLLARNAYTYLHMPIVAAIIITAVGDELALTHPSDPVHLSAIMTLVGGPYLFLFGNQMFKWTTGDLRWPPLSHFVGQLLLLGIGIYAWLQHIDTAQLSILTTLALIATATWEWFSLNGGWRRWLLGQSAPDHSEAA